MYKISNVTFKKNINDEQIEDDIGKEVFRILLKGNVKDRATKLCQIYGVSGLPEKVSLNILLK